MKTIALRFGETFSPECGTIAAHQRIIDDKGYVWYGKLGTAVSGRIIEELMQNTDPKLLLIKSGKYERYWVHFNTVSTERPPACEYPDYYSDKAEAMKTWFKVTSFELAPKNILSHCSVISSGKPLSEVSSHSMSPYFIIEYREDEK